MSTLTPNYSLIQPGVGDAADADLWGGMLNDDLDIIDTAMYVGAFSPAETKTTTYAALEGDQNKLILGDATSAGFTISLPSAATVGTGWKISFKKIDATSNAVTIDPSGSETIDGSLTYPLGSQNQGVTLDSDGTNWRVLSTAAGTSSAGVLAVENGGTGASTASQARTNLGLGTMATQNASAIAVTGGTMSGVAISGGTISGVSGFPQVTNSAFGKIVFGAVTIQWGTTNVSGNGSSSVSFGTAFSSTPYAFLLGAEGTLGSSGGDTIKYSGLSTTGVSLINDSTGSSSVGWAVIGPT